MKPYRVLVAVASRHGSTREIASALARELSSRPAGPGLELRASVIPVESRPEPGNHDAVVLGSAVYGGRWLPAAREFATVHAATLRTRPLWLFSSGPIGSPPFPDAEPYDAATLCALLGPRGSRVLPGRLEPRLLTFAERAVVTAMRAPVGDARDWGLVSAWAEEIALDLAGGRPAPPAGRPPSPLEDEPTRSRGPVVAHPIQDSRTWSAGPSTPGRRPRTPGHSIREHERGAMAHSEREDPHADDRRDRPRHPAPR